MRLCHLIFRSFHLACADEFTVCIFDFSCGVFRSPKNWRQISIDRLCDCLFGIQFRAHDSVCQCQCRRCRCSLSVCAHILHLIYIWCQWFILDYMCYRRVVEWKKRRENKIMEEEENEQRAQSRSGDWAAMLRGTGETDDVEQLEIATNTYHKMYDCPNRFISGRLCRNSKSNAKREPRERKSRKKWLFDDDRFNEWAGGKQERTTNVYCKLRRRRHDTKFQFWLLNSSV